MRTFLFVSYTAYTDVRYDRYMLDISIIENSIEKLLQNS